ncbi:MAG: diadenylate cyclase CdaA [Saccharofermentanales bacterium]
MAESLLRDGLRFFVDLFNDLGSGILFFGGPFDIILTLLDILITTLVIYFILKLIRDSRAWQLLKGLVLIVIFAQIFTLMGLQTIGFILTNTLSVLAIALVVLFQPELRRALETVGRNSFTLLSGVVAQDTPVGKNAIYSMIDSIVRATEKMAETGTGALIIIERETKLGELAEQDNAVIMDSTVSSTLLQQIFYKGSPLHDGAVLIRNGRISAARCHVPLSDNYHLRKDYGTRHRAAIGISEMGDAIAIVVSEERKIISIAIDGRIYTLDNADALRSILHKQLIKEPRGGVISNLIKSKKKKIAEEAGYEHKNDTEEIRPKNKRFAPITVAANTIKNTKRRKFLMIITSLFISIFIWLYVQITINPVETKSFTVPLTIEGIEHLRSNGYDVEIPSNTTIITLMGRSKNLANLNPDEIIAYIDVSDLSPAMTQAIPLSVRIKKLAYFKTTSIFPATVKLKIIEFESAGAG